MRRNVEVKARLRAREEALRAALRLRGLGPVGQVCPVCPGAGQRPPQVCPGAGPGTGEGQEPPQVCPGAGPGTGEGQEPPQVCPGAGQVLLQTDTFFRVPRGRLKLRRTQDGRGELIFYERPDSAGPKLSRFSITPTADPEGLQAVLSQSLGVLGTVRKERLLFLLGQTRLHLDRVQGLGDFLELEVVLRPEQSEEDGQRLARELLRELGIGEQDLISGAYLDLLLAQGDNGDTPLSQPPAGHGQQG
ncbi:uncharacterized protein LOC132327940 isoform X3 [Haemorhous mexicanus]|uniref:uncharacterized protein LOC132327940 isoform X3 n=1 Tax=Haemorhous mexicanus TaxID=30427 RepID=UPI0028BE25CB|nr:uncharacterized protein LOC132327940 isoform X3 [Haemorhous mexicanus]